MDIWYAASSLYPAYFFTSLTSKSKFYAWLRKSPVKCLRRFLDWGCGGSRHKWQGEKRDKSIWGSMNENCLYILLPSNVVLQVSRRDSTLQPWCCVKHTWNIWGGRGWTPGAWMNLKKIIEEFSDGGAASPTLSQLSDSPCKTAQSRGAGGSGKGWELRSAPKELGHRGSAWSCFLVCATGPLGERARK